MIYTKLILPFLIVIGCIGLYMYIYYKPQQDQKESDKKSYRMKQYMGIALMVLSIIIGIYYFYMRPITVKANMYPAKQCAGCEVYVKRHDQLRGYHENEISDLRKHADSCNTCSKMCIDDLNAQVKRGAPKEIQEFTKQECIQATRHALLAKKEMDRLVSKLNSKKAAITAFKARHFDDVSGFPKVPVS